VTVATFKHRFDLSGKTALVTGGSGLLGPEHAIGLAKWNATVVLIDIDEPGLERARQSVLRQVPHATIHTFKCDITDEAALVRLRTTLESQNTPVDILVNNAALNPKMNKVEGKKTGTIEDYDMAMFDLELKVGITGTFLCSKVFGSAMAARGKGCIVNVASDLAIIAPDHRIYSETGRMEDVMNFKPAGYSVIKSAMLGLNRYLATYWAHRGVRVNCLVPGAVFNEQPKHLLEQLASRVPMRRWADKTEYQEAVAFLASDASSYMTGQQLILDGGRSIW